jgi:Fe-S-cluster-containing hydrogenase component 2
MVCSFQHTGRFSPSLARITVVKDDRNGLDYPVICHQCNECPPIESCPVGAISKELGGWTWVERQICIGCGTCIDSCKYNVIKLAENKAIICDLCEDKPECVTRCPTGALEYIETDESSETYIHAFKRLREMWNFE